MSEKPMLGGCCVCLDERGWAENPLVYCDGQACNVAVHQACYGIIKVPSGPWFCRKCESQERAAKVKCELCPHRDGALKRTDSSGWAHVVCALYIPEVTFGSVSSMEPIILQKVPPDRFSKTCFLCEEENRSSKATTGACMTCAKQGCKASFHVTCAQMSGLLCEEASSGNSTKYCGYCKFHLAKGKKTTSVYKSLSCAKVYKLPITSSSDELASPDRNQAYLHEANITKPGDIRYTKAGKKRSRSLEDSLSANTSKHKEIQPVECKKDAVLITAKFQDPSDCTAETKTLKPEGLDQQVDSLCPAQVVSEEHLAAKDNNEPRPASSLLDKERPREKLSNEDELRTNIPQNSASEAILMDEAENTPTGLTLSSLSEPAVKQQPVQENPQKKVKVPAKEVSVKKKHRENRKFKSKKSSYGETSRNMGGRKKRKKNPQSVVSPHRPVPPPITAKDPATVAGTATYPRHSVVSLTNMGLDRSETYEAHEIGENNKIYKPDLSVDGVTALERLHDQQRRDSMEFFREFGMAPDVAALVETLQTVRNDNRRLEQAIQQMARRKDQLLLIKLRLQGLQTNNISVATSSSSQQSNVEQHQASDSRVSSSPHLASPNHHEQSQNRYAIKQSLSNSQVPPYTSVTSK